MTIRIRDLDPLSARIGVGDRIRDALAASLEKAPHRFRARRLERQREQPLVAIRGQAVVNDEALAVVDGEDCDVCASLGRNLRIPEEIAIEPARLDEIARLQRHVGDADDLRTLRLGGRHLRNSDRDRYCDDGHRRSIRQTSPPKRVR